MPTLKQISLSTALLFALFSIVVGQQNTGPVTQGSASTITVGASGERVRITAPASVTQMRVEVYGRNGDKFFDNEIRGGNVFDWHLQNGQAQPLAGGDYVCVVTVKNISGRLTQRIGMVTIGDHSINIEAVDSQRLTTQQAQAIGPVEENSSWTLMGEKENQTTTVIAHDGADGQLTRGRGALSFRLGDFFSGVDQEQMRLTEKGNLGIGTAAPQSTLDVNGNIHASGTVRATGFEFPDGTVQTTGTSGRKDAAGNFVPNASGTGTVNRLAKWIDNAGTLGNSIALDNDIGLQMNVAPSPAADTNLLYLSATNGTIGVLAGSTPSYGSANGPFFAMRGNTYTTIANQRGLFTIGAGNVANPVGDEGSVKFNTGSDVLRMVIRPNGNVGVGNSNPTSLLDVGGDIKVSGNAVINGNIAAKYQDVAEWVPSRRPLTPGTLVVLDTSLANTVKASTHAYDSHVAGVVSSRPGVSLGEAGHGKVLVATTGRVKIKVDATRRPIRIGDLLVTSNTSGVAMKSVPLRMGGARLHRPGTIVGKALEPLAKGQGEILVLLSLQ